MFDFIHPGLEAFKGMGMLLVSCGVAGFLGFFAALTTTEGRFLIPASTRAFVTVGLCGGFTTFSTFSLETMNLARDGEMIKAATVEQLETPVHPENPDIRGVTIGQLSGPPTNPTYARCSSGSLAPWWYMPARRDKLMPVAHP